MIRNTLISNSLVLSVIPRMAPAGAPPSTLRIENRTRYIAKIQQIVGSDAVVWFPLNESAGAVANDLSGNDRNGAATNIIWGQAGIGDGQHAAGFNGTSSKVETAASTVYTPAEFSISFWIKAPANGVWAVVAGHTTSSAWNDGWGIYFSVAGSTLRFWAGQYATHYCQATIPAGTWTHVCCIARTSPNINTLIYINGVLAASGNASITAPNATLKLGFEAGGGWLNGDLQHTVVANRALTQAEIASLADPAGLPGQQLPGQQTVIGGSSVMAWPYPGTSFLLRDFLQTQTNFNSIFTMSAISGRDPWNFLYRLSTDCIPHNPSLIVIDALNDTGCALLALEAMIRLVWSQLPDCRFVFMAFNAYPDNSDASVDAPLGDALIAGQESIGTAYGIPVVDVSAEYKDLVKNQGHHLNEYIIDTVHPTNAGHQVAFNLLSPLLTASFLGTRQQPATLPARVYADSVNFEYAPQAKNGTDYDSVTGTWTPSGTTISSNVADSTVTYSGTFQSIGRPESDGSAQVSIDGGAYTAITFGPNGHKLASRAAHTITIKVVSGTVTISKFWAI